MHQQESRKSDAVMPLIVTATLDADAQRLFNSLREAYFPPERNVLDAHLTLFHALPGEYHQEVIRTIKPLVRETRALRFAAPQPYSLGGGVAILIDCAPLESLRAQIRAAVEALPGVQLSAQDRAKRKLHITIQNKVAPQDAKRTLQGVSMAWNPETGGEVLGLEVWRYQGGPWEPLERLAFQDANEDRDEPED